MLSTFAGKGIPGKHAFGDSLLLERIESGQAEDSGQLIEGTAGFVE
jgi:hypothetical protein